MYAIRSYYGVEAVKIATSQQIDLILMDVHLPDINGYEATIRIKKVKPQINIIAQTAYASDNERQKAINAGCIDYISKPTKKEQLLTLMQKRNNFV